MVGNLTNSMALVADSFHMLSDVIALIIAFISVRLSTKDCSTNTFGWARAEVVGALINACFLFALCFSITVQAIQRFLILERIKDPKLILLVGGVGLTINILGMIIFGHPLDEVEAEENFHDPHDTHEVENKQHVKRKKVSSGSQMNIKGVFLHVMADALGSVVVLISASVIWLTDWKYKDYLDPVLSLVIVVLICGSTWPLFRDSILILLNSTPSHIDAADVKSGLLSNVPAIKDVHELHIWQLVGKRIILTGHVEINLPKEVREFDCLVGKQIKSYFHSLGIHSTTIQFEYGFNDFSNDGCQMVCPGDQMTGELDCDENTCCLRKVRSTETVSTTFNEDVWKDSKIEMISKL